MSRALHRAILLRKACWRALDRDDMDALRKLVPQANDAERVLCLPENAHLWSEYMTFVESHPEVRAMLEKQKATVH